MANTIFLHTRLFCIYVILLTAGTDYVNAQSTTEPEKITYWAHMGLGVTSIGSLAGSAGASIQYGNGLISLRTTSNSETAELFKDGDEFFDLGLLFGFATKNPKNQTSIAVGIARLTGSRYIGESGFFFGDRVDIDPVIGLPIEAQFFLKINKFIGFGVYGYANFNSEQSFSGITLNI